ncbi:MAG TPA: YceI family protein [Gemmatimonadaceae bacterium]|nr:YceI family protein [Gemmatimonadaceae bacterium]
MTLLAILLAATVSGAKADTLMLDPAASVVHWKGTKFWGLGKHEGDVRLSSGYVVLGDRGVSGTFVVDMRTIEVTDIPADEPVPRNRLRNHLMNADFFDVARFPTASFDVRSAESTDAGFRLGGNLTMRGVTRPIALDAEIQRSVGGIVRATSTFRINRHQWGVSFRGSRLTNDLVDDDILLTLDLILMPRGRS